MLNCSQGRNHPAAALTARCLLVLGLSSVFFGYGASRAQAADTTGGGTKHANCGHEVRFDVKSGKKTINQIFLRPRCDKDEDNGDGFDFTSQKASSKAPKGTILQFTVAYFNENGDDICTLNPNAMLPYKVDVRATRVGYQLDRLTTTGTVTFVGTIGKKYNVYFQKCGTYDVAPQSNKDK